MNRKRLKINSLTSNFLWTLSQAPAWRAIIGLFLIIILCLLIGAAPILIIVFPLGSFAVGIFLYQRYPILYVGFAWWMLFLAPLIRRLIDYKCGYNTPFPNDLASLLVTSISLITVVRHFPKNYNKDGLPFTLCIVTVLYGFFIGLIQQSTTDYEREIIVLLSWLNPICFGFHVFVNWRDYPSLRQNIQRTFFWIVLATGVYGIFQFLLAPPWDNFYLVSHKLSHLGRPEPLRIRVFSTMGESVQFAANLIPGLLLLLISKEKWRFIAAGSGYLVFLLSQARTPWYSYAIAIVLFVFSLKGSHQIRTIITIALVVFLIVPLTNIEPFSEQITSRIESFADLENDGSYQKRTESFNRSINYALSRYVGYGLTAPGQAPPQEDEGSKKNLFSVNDSGYLALFVSFGWVGTIAYVSGLILLFFRVFQVSTSHLDIFMICARAIALSSLLRLPTSNVTTASYAMPIWCFLGIAVAGYKYYHAQCISSSKVI